MGDPNALFQFVNRRGWGEMRKEVIFAAGVAVRPFEWFADSRSTQLVLLESDFGGICIFIAWHVGPFNGLHFVHVGV